MSSEEESTERSPLLRKPSQTEGQASQTPNGVPGDNNSHSQPAEAVSAELDQARKNVKRMFPVLAIGIFLALLDQSIVAAINSKIGDDLEALQSISWIATAYFLTMTCSQPLYGKMSDVLGRKPCLLFALLMFGIGSMACGLTGTMAGLIAGRAVQGVGGGGMLIVVTVIFSDVIPMRDRGTYQGFLNLVGAIGSTSGGPIGGYFAQGPGWRWAFLVQVILCFVAILLVSLFLNLPHKKSETSAREKLVRIDFIGALLLILIVFGLLFGLDRGTNVSWRSPVALVSLCLPVPLLFALLLVETRFAVEPFLPGHIIFDRNLCACYAHNFFVYAGLTAFLFYIPFFFEVVLEMTPAQAGTGLIPLAISCVLGTLIGGLILKRIGRFYWLAVIASTTAAVASVLIAIAPSLQHKGSLIAIFVASVLSFLPLGVTVTASLIAVISNVSAADQAVATACSFLFRSLGAGVGVSLVGLVVQHVLSTSLQSRIDPAEASRILEHIAHSLEYTKTLPPETAAIVQESYGKGVQAGFVMCTCLEAAAAFSTVWWRERRIDK